MKSKTTALLALALFVPYVAPAASVISFEVGSLGVDPFDGSGWGYRSDLQTGPQPFSATADFVPTVMAGAEAPSVGGPWSGGEGGLVINANSNGGLRTVSMTSSTAISLASSIDSVDYRWQKLTANNSAAPNVKFEIIGLTSPSTYVWLGNIVYNSQYASAATNTWVTETSIEDVSGWWGTSSYYNGGYNQTLAAVLSNIAGNWGNGGPIYATSVQVGIGSSGPGGTPISGVVDWITFDVDGGGFGDATIATNFIPEPTMAFGGILCMLGLGIRRRGR